MIEFTIPGTPKGKERPRFTKNGRAFTPKETVAAEREVLRLFCDAVAPSFEPFVEPLHVVIWSVFPIPDSYTKAQKEACLAGHVWHTSKPDRDNVEKLVLDALNGHAWMDDAQICGGGTFKRYGSPARTIVRIFPAPPLVDGAQPPVMPAEKARLKRREETPTEWLARKQKANNAKSRKASPRRTGTIK